MSTTTSENNDTSFQVKCELRACARPHVMRVTVPKAQVQNRLDTVWAHTVPSIPSKAKRGFRDDSPAFRAHWEAQPKGLTQLYNNVWRDALHQGAATHRRFILDLVTLNATVSGDDYIVDAEVYFSPPVTFTNVPPERLQAEVYSLHPKFIGRQVDEVFADLIKKERRWAELSPPNTITGGKVDLIIVAEKAGKPWPEGSGTHSDLALIEGRVFPQELYEAILGKKSGDEFEVDCPALPANYGRDAGKSAKMKVKIARAYTPVPETDEAVIERLGLGSLDALRAKTEEQIKESMLSAREGNKVSIALHKLRTTSSMEPIPTRWLNGRVSLEIEGLLASNKGKSPDEVARIFGLTDLKALRHTIATQISDALREELTVLAYATLLGYADFTTTFEKALQKAHEFFISRIDIVEVDPISVREPQDQVSKPA